MYAVLRQPKCSLVLCGKMAAFATVFFVLLLMLLQTGRSGLKTAIWDPAEEDLSTLDADSDQLIQILRGRILPPSRLAYNLTEASRVDPSEGQVEVIRELLGDMRNGVYVESGAYIGEALSNSLFFERERGWAGVLIEPDVLNFKKLLNKRRKAYVSNACLSQFLKPEKVVMSQYRYAGAVMDKSQYSYLFSDGVRMTQAQCYPFYTFVKALNFTTIDYFSLDVEGLEYKVLATIPWDKVNIRTISVEYNMIAEGKEKLVKLLTSKGFVLYMDMIREYSRDYIFVRRDVLDDNRKLTRALPIVKNVSKKGQIYPLLAEDWPTQW